MVTGNPIINPLDLIRAICPVLFEIIQIPWQRFMAIDSNP